jgi:hypothetical protein
LSARSSCGEPHEVHRSPLEGPGPTSTVLIIEIVEHESEWELRVAPSVQLARVSFDGAVRLLLGDASPYRMGTAQDSAEIIIEQRFTLRTPGTEYAISPPSFSTGEQLVALVSMLWASVEQVLMGTDGELTVVLNGDRTISVPSHPSYESWGVNGSDGLQVISKPGGGLTRFSPPTQ